MPTRDGDGPSILFDALAAGEVGKEYVLPEVTIVDLSEIKEQSVKVYLVGTELTEIILTEKDAVRSASPSSPPPPSAVVWKRDSNTINNNILNFDLSVSLH